MTVTIATDTTRFVLLRALFDLAREQRHALEARAIERFEALLDDREELLQRIQALTLDAAGEALPANVIPFPGAIPIEAEDALALDTLINGILEHDRHNERLLNALLGEVAAELPALEDGRRGAASYGTTVSDARFIDLVS
jgi:hypothetical protein